MSVPVELRLDWRPVLLLVLPALLISAQGLQSSRPNIVVILADDVGWNDVSFHGSDQFMTPNIDALAYNGIILNRHYVQQSSTPSRAALLTGRYPIHTGMQGRSLQAGEENGLPTHFELLPQHLKKLGYRTHIVGKWHLGYFRQEFTPLERGFDTHFGFYNSYVGYFDYLHQIVHPAPDGGQTVTTGLDVHKNGTPAWELVGKYSTDAWTQEATRIIRDHPLEEPLFLYLAQSAGHSSHQGRFLEAPQPRVNAFKYILGPNRRTYAAMISKLDDSVGDVVEALRDRGILDNTIILFMSDNGAPMLSSTTPNWGSNFPLRGGKETLWEGGVRSASFIWSASFQQSPRVSSQLIHITDWLPTLFSAAGGAPYLLPTSLDGIDQWRALNYDLDSERQEALVNIDEKERSAGIVATLIDQDTVRRTWKLIVGGFAGGKFDEIGEDPGSPTDPPYEYKRIYNSKAYKAINTFSSPGNFEGNMRLLRDQSTVRCTLDPALRRTVADCSSPCLFDLDSDPCEQYDVSPRHREIVQYLYDRLKALRRELVPQGSRQLDLSSASPSRFNNTWAVFRL